MKYRKRPIVIEANVYSAGMEDGFAIMHDGTSFQDGMDRVAHSMSADDAEYTTMNFSLLELRGAAKSDPEYLDELKPYINTLEGRHFINDGDYIIQGVQGELYPCKPDIFHAAYEKVG